MADIWHPWDRREMHERWWWGSLEEGDNLEDKRKW